MDNIRSCAAKFHGDLTDLGERRNGEKLPVLWKVIGNLISLIDRPGTHGANCRWFGRQAATIRRKEEREEEEEEEEAAAVEEEVREKNEAVNFGGKEIVFGSVELLTFFRCDVVRHTRYIG
ncbi:hypothetical protein GWI33_016448 [Rhynchophorus ferrugineus]|uniref:Uncharacterized protein n=1 Tax=Rhynchophorus ferrugineus TaxID=354439 RepID=A0A834MAC8_RHYFE|nr:hypothetical protein GWI33_016448 [Rhynchophorus ferrugineus]